ncbi:MAG: 4-hydroxy-tetrahydrodipicolinate synthase [Acidiferrobacterales bacterium]|nr:4-hydroxy-tetrahydrodipicolinate synthase [Acidiferrobacterales bacterium]
MIKGSLVALVTPMFEDGSVDYDGLEKLVDFHVEAKTDAIISVGTSGESATLDIPEQIDVIRKTKEFAAGRIPIIAGTGGNSTSEAMELTEKAATLGVDACLLVVPYYNKPTQEGLYQHFRYIAERVNVPQILYNVPGRTSLDMHNDTVVRLSEVDNIIGIKDATADVPRVEDFLARCGNDFVLYSGDDATTLEFIKAGGHGCISVTANVAPAKMHQMCMAALEGDLALAEKLNDQLDGLHKELFVESNPIPAKWAVAKLGLIPDGIRLPLTRFSESYHAQLEKAMQRAGVL